MKYVISYLLIFLTSFAFAASEAPQTFTLDGRLFADSAGTTPLTDTDVDLVFQILDSTQTCILYEETRTNLNASASNGYFTYQIGSATGDAKRSAGDNGLTMKQVYSNTPQAGLNGKLLANIATPCAHTPTAGQQRYLRVQVTPSSDSVTRVLTPFMAIDSVPNAVVAEHAESAGKLGSLSSSDVLQVNTTAGYTLSQSNLESIFTTSNFSALTTLLAGTSTLYNKPASNGTTVIPSIASPSSPAAGQVWYNAGNILYHDGTTTRTISTGSSSSVAAGDGSAATPSISFSSDANTGWYLAAPDTLAAATGGVERARIDASGNLGVGSTAPGARLTLGGAATAAAWGSAGIGIRQNSSTYTDSSSTGTVGFNYVNAFGVPTLAASSATTYTNASAFSLYPPQPGANVTLTNSTGLTVNASTLTGVTNGYGLQVNAPTGATNNYAASFMDGNVGVGTSAPTSPFSVVSTTTVTGGSNFQIFNDYTVANATNTAATYWGQKNAMSYTGAGNVTGSLLAAEFSSARNSATAGTASRLIGAVGVARNDSAGTTTTAIGVNGYSRATAGSITTATGGQFEVTTSAGTIGTGYGIYVGNVQATTKYSIFASDATAPSYFAGNVGIGTTAPTSVLQLKAGTATAGTAPLKFTTGTNLTTPEDGAMEYSSGALYFTVGATRYTIPLNGSTSSYTNISNISNAAGDITMSPVATTGAVKIDSGTTSINSTSGALIVTGGVGVSGSIHAGGAINAGTTLSAGTNAFIPQIYGGATAAANIKIDGSSNATPGNVLLATGSGGGNVGIGTTAPASVLEIKPAANGDILRVSNTSGNVAAKFSVSGGGHGRLQIRDSGGTFDRFDFDASVGNLLLKNTGGVTNTSISSDGSNSYILGNVGIGTTAPTGKFSVVGDGGTADIYQEIYGAAFIPTFKMYKARNTAAVPNVVQDGDTLMRFQGAGYDGGTSRVAAQMRMQVDGTPGLGDMPGRLMFDTVPDGSTSAVERMRITSAGNVGIGTTAPTALLDVQGGTAAASTNGVGINLIAQAGGTVNQNGGAINITGGAGAGTGNGGNINLTAGASTGTDGIVNLIGPGPTSVSMKRTDAAKLLQFSQSGTGNPWQIATTGNAGLDIRALGGYINIANTSGKIYLDTTGNVGIGTTSPAYKFEVAGTIATTSGGVRFPDSTTQTTSAKQVLSGCVAASVPASTTQFGTFGGSSTSGTEANRQIVLPFGGTLEKLYVITSGAQPGTGALTVTLRKNAADTSVTVTLAAGAAAGTYSDVVNSVSVAAGDTIGLQFANAASAPTGNIGCYSIMFTPN